MAIFLHNQQQCELQHTTLICGGRQAHEGDQDENNGCFFASGGLTDGGKESKNVCAQHLPKE